MPPGTPCRDWPHSRARSFDDLPLRDWQAASYWLGKRMAPVPWKGLGEEDAKATCHLALVQAMQDFDPQRGRPYPYLGVRVRGTLWSEYRRWEGYSRLGRPGQPMVSPVRAVTFSECEMEEPDFRDTRIGQEVSVVLAVVVASVLSGRERLWLEGRLAGHTNREIAEALHISEPTLYACRRAVIDALREVWG